MAAERLSAPDFKQQLRLAAGWRLAKFDNSAEFELQIRGPEWGDWAMFLGPDPLELGAEGYARFLADVLEIALSPTIIANRIS